MGPLTDIRVLDLSRLLPGPFCTRLFADMGADVIKVEEPVKGDYSRDFVPRRGDFACWFMEVNRNKKSVALDLKQEKDRAIFLELARTAQVVVESYRPGVLQKLGVDFNTVKKSESENSLLFHYRLRETGPPGEAGGSRYRLPEPGGADLTQRGKGREAFHTRRAGS